MLYFICVFDQIWTALPIKCLLYKYTELELCLQRSWKVTSLTTKYLIFQISITNWRFRIRFSRIRWHSNCVLDITKALSIQNINNVWSGVSQYCFWFSKMVLTFTLSSRYEWLSMLVCVCVFWSPIHDDVIKWKHFPYYWPLMQGIYWSPVNSPKKGQWRRALMFSSICTWMNGWVNNGEAGDLRRHRTHYGVIVMFFLNLPGRSRAVVSTWCNASLSMTKDINDRFPGAPKRKTEKIQW